MNRSEQVRGWPRCLWAGHVASVLPPGGARRFRWDGQCEGCMVLGCRQVGCLVLQVGTRVPRAEGTAQEAFGVCLPGPWALERGYLGGGLPAGKGHLATPFTPWRAMWRGSHILPLSS